MSFLAVQMLLGSLEGGSLWHFHSIVFSSFCIGSRISATSLARCYPKWNGSKTHLAREIKIFIRAVYYSLLRKFNSPPNLVRDKGIYSTRAGSILTSAGSAWDLRVQLMEHECEDQ